MRHSSKMVYGKMVFLAVLCLVVIMAAPAGAAIVEVQKIVADDSAAGDLFGPAVAFAGDTALVGAHMANGEKGAAYIVVLNGDTWTQAAKLTATDSAVGDQFGNSVALTDSYALVGTLNFQNPAEAAYIFEKPAGGWTDMTETAKLTNQDGASGNQFGFSVALYGDTALIGSHSGGGAYIFTRNSGAWTRTAILTATDSEEFDTFGYYVFIAGDCALVSALNDDNNTGSAYVFEKPGGGWADMTETAKLTASDRSADDRFGSSLALDGDTLFVGTFNANAAYVFVKPGASWADMTETAILTASDAAAGDDFGRSVGLLGGAALITACNIDTGAGAAYVFNGGGGAWTETAKLTAGDDDGTFWFGASVFSAALSSDYFFVGAGKADNDTGALYVFAEGEETAAEEATSDGSSLFGSGGGGCFIESLGGGR